MADLSRKTSRVEIEERSTDTLPAAVVSTWQLILVIGCVLLAPAVLRFGPFDEAPTFDTRIRQELERLRPRYVFLGNSMLESRIDPATLDARLGPGVALVLGEPATTSAYWYLVTKNQIAAASHPPEKLFVFFRDQRLTEPGRRTGGLFARKLRAASRPQEPEFEAILAADRSWQERLGGRLERLYPIQTWLDLNHVIRRGVAWLLGVSGRYNAMFELEKLRASRRDDLAEPVAAAALDFEQRVGRSFLPALLDLAKARGIELHLVRVQRRPGREGPPVDPPELRAYLEELGAFVRERGGRYHDFHGDPELGLDRYRNGDHIADRSWYTRFFLERLSGEFE